MSGAPLSPLRGRGGFTVVELIVGFLILATMTLALAQAFRSGLLANRVSSSESDVLTNARIAMNGNGSFPGMIADISSAAYVASLSSSVLRLVDYDGSSPTYSLSSAGQLDYFLDNSTTAYGKDYASLSFQYYAKTSSDTLALASSSSSVSYVSVALTVTSSTRTANFYSGAALWNAP